MNAAAFGVDERSLAIENGKIPAGILFDVGGLPLPLPLRIRHHFASGT